MVEANSEPRSEARSANSSATRGVIAAVEPTSNDECRQSAVSARVPINASAAVDAVIVADINALRSV